jgi:hypothetical protein
VATAEHDRQALGDKAARQLANTTKTPPQMQAITPRWLVRFLQWVPVESGTYRINRVKSSADIDVACGQQGEAELPSTFVDYEDKPREHTLSMISTVLDVHTRVSDLFSSPHNQIQEQLRLAIEVVKERQESELINNADYGLLKRATPAMRVSTRGGAPTPDDFDELIARVWKEPAIFLAHPLAVAAFGRECTRRGVPPATVTLFGSTNVLLLRVGEKKQGVVGLFQPNLPGEQTPGLSVRFMQINRNAIATYLIALYCSAAVLVDDALGVLENVEVGQYHESK